MEKTSSGRKISEKQQAFLDILTDPESPAFGDIIKAKNAAGYSPNTKASEVLDGLGDALIEAANTQILTESIKSVTAIVEIRDDPSQIGAANKLKAADSLLDRAGVVKKSQVEVKHEAPSTIFILPAKADLDSDEE